MLRNVRSRMPVLASFAAGLALVGAVVVQPTGSATASTFHLPNGWTGGRSSTAIVGGIEATEVEITGLSTNFGIEGAYTRNVQVTAVLRVQTTIPSTANAYIDVYMPSCNCLYRRVAASNTYMPNTGGAGSETMVVTGFTALGPGTWNASVWVKRSVGTGVISVSQTTGAPQQLWVEDMGA